MFGSGGIRLAKVSDLKDAIRSAAPIDTELGRVAVPAAAYMARMLSRCAAASVDSRTTSLPDNKVRRGECFGQDPASAPE